MNRFLDNLEIPTIEPGDREGLDRRLTQSETTAAIGDVRTGKSPGPDSYPPEFFNEFKDKLAPIMLEVFNESLGKGSLPPTLTQATITLLYSLSPKRIRTLLTVALTSYLPPKC